MPQRYRRKPTYICTCVEVLFGLVGDRATLFPCLVSNVEQAWLQLLLFSFSERRGGADHRGGGVYSGLQDAFPRGLHKGSSFGFDKKFYIHTTLFASAWPATPLFAACSAPPPPCLGGGREGGGSGVLILFEVSGRSSGGNGLRHTPRRYVGSPVLHNDRRKQPTTNNQQPRLE